MAKRGKRLADGCTVIRQGGLYITLDPKGHPIPQRSGKPVQKTR